jgi:hypothetical protein
VYTREVLFVLVALAVGRTCHRDTIPTSRGGRAIGCNVVLVVVDKLVVVLGAHVEVEVARVVESEKRKGRERGGGQRQGKAKASVVLPRGSQTRPARHVLRPDVNFGVPAFMYASPVSVLLINRSS